MFLTKSFYANTRVLQLVSLFLWWLFNLLSFGSVLTVMFTAILCLVTICQFLGISRILRVDEYNRTEYARWELSLKYCPFKSKITFGPDL